jgi:hypothetical protein
MTRFLALILIFSFTVLWAGDYSYMGVDNCKMCHKKVEKGNQFGVWSESKHATALETLKGEEAAKIVTEKGIEGSAAEAAECLSCHVTGFGKSKGYEVQTAEFIENPDNARAVKKNNSKANVGCESCHGPGSGYKSKTTMEGIHSGEIEADSVGLWTATVEVCTTCHNEKSPTYKEFDFEKMVAKIAHPYPE